MKIKFLVNVFAILTVFSVILTGCQSQTTTTQTTAGQTTTTQTTTAQASESSDDVDLVIELTAKDFAFSETSITVKKGQTVRVELTITDGTHDWVLDEFSAKTKQASTGTVTVEFTADKTGEFEYYCSVGSHRSMGMVGTLIVEE